MADDIKRINCVKVCFSDRAFIDLGRIAAHEDRTVPEILHLLARQYLYGKIARHLPDEEGPERASDGQ
jgi:hypothetical protein